MKELRLPNFTENDIKALVEQFEIKQYTYKVDNDRIYEIDKTDGEKEILDFSLTTVAIALNYFFKNVNDYDGFDWSYALEVGDTYTAEHTLTRLERDDSALKFGIDLVSEIQSTETFGDGYGYYVDFEVIDDGEDD